MDKIYGIILTLIAGLFFLLGGLISVKVKNKEKLNIFSVSLAFVIMINLIAFDLIPEILELFDGIKLGFKFGLMILFIVVGILLLKMLDIFIPDHHHEHHDNEKNKKEHESHVRHIGTLTVISLTLHNILEGFAIFGMSLSDFRIGLFTCISVALHNIPLGTHIFSSLSLKKNKVLISVLTFSSLLGGLIFIMIGSISNLVLGIITCITLGMLIYIAVLELLPEIIGNYQKKEAKIGLLIGLIILVISILI